MRRYLLYYITDRTQFPGEEGERLRLLLDKIEEAARAGVDLIQLREKDLPTRDLEALGREAVRRVRAARTDSRLLINSRTDVALAVAADGVHLRSEDVPVAVVRKIAERAGVQQRWTIGVSCHSPAEVRAAADAGADFAVFAPVFEKPGAEPAGLDPLRAACAAKVPVLALGGVSLENAELCLRAGAAGLAGIRLFQQHEVESVVKRVRNLRG
jgi:thiamine-phosphate pyrophosphorylase